MRLLWLVPALALLACAPNAAMRKERADRREGDAALLKATDKAEDRLNRIEMRDLQFLEGRIESLERELLGPWDDATCERYKPEAQRAFCHRLPKFQPYAVPKENKDKRKSAVPLRSSLMGAEADVDFQEALDAATRDTNKKFERQLRVLKNHAADWESAP